MSRGQINCFPLVQKYKFKLSLAAKLRDGCSFDPKRAPCARQMV